MSITKIKGGVVHDGKGKQFITLRDAMAHDTLCGCGVNCKEGFLALPNFNPVSGDIDGFYAVYIVDGSITIEPVADARAAIKAFCLDADVSAASVSIGGCLPLVDLVEGLTRQLTVTVLPSGSVQTGTWTSDDTDIATVSIAGLVTAVAAGTATITFTSTDGGLTATCVVTVVEA